MKLKLLSILGLITFSVILFSCTSSVKGTAANENSVVILDSFQTPIIRGAGQLKGMRIGVNALLANQSFIDSIKYEDQTMAVSLLKTINDTVWVEAYFYPKEFNKEGVENTTEYASKQCVIFYHDKSVNDKIVISNLKLITDHTMWK